MYNIEREPSDNIGGLQAIYYTDQSNIATEPETVGLAITGNITLVDTATWYKLEATLPSRAFRQQDKTDRSGILQDQQLKGIKAKDTYGTGQSFAELKGRRLATLYKDQNGVVRYIPNAELTKDFDTDAVGGRNGYAFTIKAVNKQEALYYTGAIPLTGSVLAG